jgi:hypothetical protein
MESAEFVAPYPGEKKEKCSELDGLKNGLYEKEDCMRRSPLTLINIQRGLSH